MERFISIHGHFYQPPRENPWLETVELQDSAQPYHDWNERITAECYAPNATARLLDGGGRISRITNNYSRISFDFGPTLLSWMKERMPEVHDAIIAADKLSHSKFSGHGSAMAQVYNHVIMPLAHARDKYTQALWGIRDFEYRFGRFPEGMWLSEAAVDTETLETLAQLGIKFTILSPYQASRVRESGKQDWYDVSGGRIDPSRAYRVNLPSGRSISLFFYDGPVSQAVAFEGLLFNGERFANRLMSAFNGWRQWDQIVHIATDGESYGHHHRYGEMALAYALDYIERNHLARLTNFGEYLEKHPAIHEVQIHEKSSWSCAHGVGRWMRDCGCNSGGHFGWNQAWRAPLRNSLDWLRDQLAELFNAKASQYIRDPWASRDDYISVILDRSAASREGFFSRHEVRSLSAEERVTVLKLMELQRHAMLMFTSCGWFFDEISGLESVQVIQYAARALQLGQDLFQRDLESGFLDRLEVAKSNIPEHQDGRCIYNKFVKPAVLDWLKTVAHYSVSSVFQNYSAKTRIFSYTFENEERELFVDGKSRLAIGRTEVLSEITQESDTLTYAILYMGEHNLVGGVGKFETAAAYRTILGELKAPFEAADLVETIRRLDRHFGHSSYSLKSLFKDEQQRVLDEILASARDDLEHRFRLVIDRYAPLIKFLQSAGARWPAALETVADFVLHEELRHCLASQPIDLARLRLLLREAASRGNRVLDADISFAIKNQMEFQMRQLAGEPNQPGRIRNLQELAQMVMPLRLGPNLWRVQNFYWEILQTVFPNFRARAANGEKTAEAWLDGMVGLGNQLGFAMKAWESSASSIKLAA